MTNNEVQFPIGRLHATAGAVAVIPAVEMFQAIIRHVQGDWGCVEKADHKHNDEALCLGGRLWSAYKTQDGIRFLVVTHLKHAETTVMLPCEFSQWRDAWLPRCLMRLIGGFGHE